jgi:rhodanese-related sulfurtransferase
MPKKPKPTKRESSKREAVKKESIKREAKRKSARRAHARKSLPWLYISLAGIVLIGLATFVFYRSANPLEINAARAHAKYQEGAFILDVRRLDEWDTVRIPGATLIPLEELASRVAEVPKGREVVVVCRSGNRSQEGRDILRAAGFEQVTSMAGGMIDWQVAGYPVEQ